jgi:hypothetical protein
MKDTSFVVLATPPTGRYTVFAAQYRLAAARSFIGTKWVHHTTCA